MNNLVLIFLIAIVIDQVTDIIATVDLIEGLRARFRKAFPSIAKLSWCSFCQSFWLSMVIGLFLPLSMVSGLFAWPLLGFVAKWVVVWMLLFGTRNYINKVTSLANAAEDFIRLYIPLEEEEK